MCVSVCECALPYRAASCPSLASAAAVPPPYHVCSSLQLQWEEHCNLVVPERVQLQAVALFRPGWASSVQYVGHVTVM